MTRRWLLPLLALGLAYASLAQGVGWNQNAHYALVRALADGTAVVDPYRSETGDVSWRDGHYYSTKAPGLALVTLPVYVALDGLGLKELMARAPGASDATVGVLWALGLVGCVLPALAIALLVRRLGDEPAPGLGLAAGVTAGLATLLLPFATLFFSHVLAAALGFAAFALLWLRRGVAAVAGAGALAGFAITTEYPLAIVAFACGLYAVARGEVVRRAAAYTAGLAAGVAPLLLYNWWAFGSPLSLSYEDAVLTGGVTGHDVLGANEPGFFGVGVPSVATAIELLFASVGLLRLAPVVALGAVGTILLYRRGWRAEALVIGGVALAYLVYNSGYFQPFGGFVPGPRFLLPILPFLAVPLALAYRRLPLTTLVLAAISAALMVAVTITGPLLAFDARWHERLADGWFAGRSWPAVVPFLALVAVTLVLAARATKLAPTRAEAPVAAVSVGGWALLWVVAPEALEGWTRGEVAVVAALALASVVVAVAADRGLAGRLRPAATLD